MPYQWIGIIVGAGILLTAAIEARADDGTSAPQSPPENKTEAVKSWYELPPNLLGDEKYRESALDIESRYHALEDCLADQLRVLQGIGPQGSDILLGDAKYDNSASRTGFGYYLRERTNRLSYAEEEVIAAAGTIRAQRCTQLLLNRIALSRNVHYMPRIPRPFVNGRPAFDALCRIGEPACSAALARIPLEPDADSRTLMVNLLRTCLGTSKARSWLMELQSGIPEDADQRRRIAEAIEQIDSHRSGSSPRVPPAADSTQEMPGDRDPSLDAK